MIYCGDVDVTERVLACTKKGNFNAKSIIGQTPSFQLDISLDNRDSFFDYRLNFAFTYVESGSDVEEVYLAYEKPERYTKELKLKLYDRSYELAVAYDTKLDYGSGNINIRNQLNEISELTGFNIEISNIPDFILDKKVHWYDNSIIIRDYLGWIAELFCANLKVTGINSFGFKQLSKSVSHYTEIVADYEKDELYVIKGVCFDNSILKSFSGDESGNILYISSNNPYMDDGFSDEVVSYVYDNIKDLAVWSMKKLKTKDIYTLDLGDLVSYAGLFSFMVTDISSKVTTINNISQDLKGIMVSKNEEKQINRITDATRTRILRVEFNQEKLKWAVTAEEINKTNEKLSEIELDIDSVELRVSQTETNVANVTNNMAQIEVRMDSITHTVTETVGDVDDVREQQSQLEQKVDELTTNFTIKGGNNLIPNSMGQFEDMDETDDFSQGGTNTDGVTYQYGEFTSFKNLTESGMALGGLMPAEKDFWIRRITPITLVPGKEYTLTYRLTNIGNNNTLTFAVYHGDKRVELNKTSDQMELREFTYTFIAEADLEYAIGGGNADTTIENKAYSYVTELTLVGGNTRQDWQPAANELYGGGVKINYKGIQVYSEGSDTTTYINNTGFDIKSGHGTNSLLTVNKDRTKMNRAEINGGMVLDDIPFEKITVNGRNLLMIG